MKKILLILALAAASGVVIAALAFNALTGPYDKGSKEYEIVDIPQGAYIGKAAGILHENKLIRSELLFRIVAKLEGDPGIKAGRYKIFRSYSNSEILSMLEEGKVYNDSTAVTIPEGFESYKIAERLEKLGLANEARFMELVGKPEAFESKVDFIKGESLSSLEGYLFPDTYFFKKGTSEEEIIETMLKRFEQVYGQSYKKRQLELGKSLNDVITMASIVEREAKMDSERDMVSAVFYNRLKIGQRLQSCATVQYILKERKQKLSDADLLIESPYNTYKYAGLPPGPIASPGKKSIEAALYPANVDYLYFVAKKDGSHTFSRTYDEHLKAKAKNFAE